MEEKKSFSRELQEVLKDEANVNTSVCINTTVKDVEVCPVIAGGS